MFTEAKQPLLHHPMPHVDCQPPSDAAVHQCGSHIRAGRFPHWAPTLSHSIDVPTSKPVVAPCTNLTPHGCHDCPFFFPRLPLFILSAGSGHVLFKTQCYTHAKASNDAHCGSCMWLATGKNLGCSAAVLSSKVTVCPDLGRVSLSVTRARNTLMLFSDMSNIVHAWAHIKISF